MDVLSVMNHVCSFVPKVYIYICLSEDHNLLGNPDGKFVLILFQIIIFVAYLILRIKLIFLL